MHSLHQYWYISFFNFSTHILTLFIMINSWFYNVQFNFISSAVFQHIKIIIFKNILCVRIEQIEGQIFIVFNVLGCNICFAYIFVLYSSTTTLILFCWHSSAEIYEDWLEICPPKSTLLNYDHARNLKDLYKTLKPFISLWFTPVWWRQFCLLDSLMTEAI